MSGIAEVLHNLGYQVTGSDLYENSSTERLKGLGVAIASGHGVGNIQGADVVVVSSAVGPDNIEVCAAREARIPVVPRAEMLAELMRFRQGIAVAGTHGKTTTTSLIASLLAEAGLDPTFVIGGRLNSARSHARLGSGRYLVAEADESDASFLHLKPVMAVLTNIDADHMETYGDDFSRLRRTFIEFLHHLPFYGLAVVCADDPVVRGLIDSLGRPVLTYGIEAPADLRAKVIRQDQGVTRFQVIQGLGAPLDFTLNLPGNHNVLNALAAIAVARELGASDEVIRSALERFEGIARRSQVLGELRIGTKRTVLIDDYAHHPREIEATLDALRRGWPGRRLAVAFEPHRYTRTRDLFDDFVQVLSTVDRLVLFSTYAAGERPIPGTDGRTLCHAIRRKGRIEPTFLQRPAELVSALPRVVEDGDLVVTLGAGSIGTLAPMLWRSYGAGQREAVGC
jgi:UDP-N-acetylmuramate--alanine ligase